MKRSRIQEAKGPVDLVEEACHLLRHAPAAAWTAYYLGAAPFLLGLLYFLSDMSRSAFAWQRLPGASLSVALLFGWMKCWQSVFASRLLHTLSGAPAPRWTLARLSRLAATQAFLQPLGFLILPPALALVFPLGWAYAFFANVTVLGTGEDRSLRSVCRRVWRQTLLWPGQNHYVLCLYQLLIIFVLLNLAATILFVPLLLQKLLGIETPFSRSPAAMLNTTFLSALLAVGYLCLDPFIKATYVLRCFYGESLKSGLDLRAELQRFPSPLRSGLRLFPFLLLPLASFPANSTAQVLPNRWDRPQTAACSVGQARTDPEPEPATRSVQYATFNAQRSTFNVHRATLRGSCEGRARCPQRAVCFVSQHSPARRAEDATPHLPYGALTAVTPGPGDPLTADELDRAIDQTLHRREYTWRLPRQTPAENESASDQRYAFLRSLGEMLVGLMREIGRWFKSLIDWLNLGWPPAPSRTGPGYDWLSGLRALLLLLLAVLGILLSFLLYRAWQRRRSLPTTPPASIPLSRPPDLADENLTADELPEESWLRLARECMAQGDLRLALRALYLASLARLAARNLITLAQYKSNRDYASELDRRAHALPDLVRLFRENVAVFDWAWYGLHEVTQDILDHFARQVDQIQGSAHLLPDS